VLDKKVLTTIFGPRMSSMICTFRLIYLGPGNQGGRYRREIRGNDNCIQNIIRKPERERPLRRVIYITSNTSQGCWVCCYGTDSIGRAQDTVKKRSHKKREYSRIVQRLLSPVP